MKSFFKVIPSGSNKGKRIYYENLCGVDDVWPIEIYYLFINAFKMNYKIFYFISNPTHSIEISKKDLTFLNSTITEKNYEQYKFSNEVLQLKNLQIEDINTIYNLSIQTDKISAFFSYPLLKSNFYCFDFFLIVKNDFDLNNILNLNLKLIKIYSIVEYFEHTITMEIIQKLYNIPKLQFKDYVVLFQDLQKVYLKEIEFIQYTPEYKKLIQLMRLSNKYIIDNNTCATPFDEEISKLDEIVNLKTWELRDMELYKKLFFSKLCCQYWVFNKDILGDSIFFTDFFELTHASVLNKDINNNVIINYDFLYSSSLLDIHENDPYKLFNVFQPVYQWKKKIIF